MSDADVAAFEAFLQGWLVRQREYLDELISAQRRLRHISDEDILELINKILCHYGQYYEEKSSIAHKNVFLVFSPPWFSSLERSFFLVGGFKPGMAFQVATTAVADLSDDQKERLTKLKQETRMKERDLNDELAKLHESVAAPPLSELAKSHGKACINNGFMAEESSVSTHFRETLESLLTSGDALRTGTALEVMQILRPDQTLKFLASVAEFQLRVRSVGMDKDASNAGNAGQA